MTLSRGVSAAGEIENSREEYSFKVEFRKSIHYQRNLMGYYHLFVPPRIMNILEFSRILSNIWWLIFYSSKNILALIQSYRISQLHKSPTFSQYLIVRL
jgi:hypothetical protein